MSFPVQGEFMTFQNWLEQRRKEIPKADQVLLLLQSAGSSGVPENALRSHVELPRSLMDDLLNALVSAGQVVVKIKDGKRVFSSISFTLGNYFSGGFPMRKSSVASN
jgi:hypothetical protein